MGTIIDENDNRLRPTRESGKEVVRHIERLSSVEKAAAERSRDAANNGEAADSKNKPRR